MNRKNQIWTPNLSSQIPPRLEHAAQPVCPTRKRLAEGFAYLERLDAERGRGSNSILGRFMEQRIIWRELLELERHAADEQIEGPGTRVRAVPPERGTRPRRGRDGPAGTRRSSVGAMPPFGQLYAMPVFEDESLT
jgi:hypothetical protein